jgi:hypothetical protein
MLDAKSASTVPPLLAFPPFLLSLCSGLSSDTGSRVVNAAKVLFASFSSLLSSTELFYHKWSSRSLYNSRVVQMKKSAHRRLVYSEFLCAAGPLRRAVPALMSPVGCIVCFSFFFFSQRKWSSPSKPIKSVRQCVLISSSSLSFHFLCRSSPIIEKKRVIDLSNGRIGLRFSSAFHIKKKSGIGRSQPKDERKHANRKQKRLERKKKRKSQYACDPVLIDNSQRSINTEKERKRKSENKKKKACSFYF